jgi:hypothetical protein
MGDRLARVATSLHASLGTFAPGPALTTKADWYVTTDDRALVVVVKPAKSPDVADEVLAYALAWQGDRDLALVLPSENLGLTLQRLPWIATPVRVFSYDQEGVLAKPQIVPSRAEVLAAASKLPPVTMATHDLKEFAPWVESLTRRLDQHWALVPAHRASYLAWHCNGRQVVQLRRSKGGVTIAAGVDYSKPHNDDVETLTADQHPALVVVIDRPLTPVETAAIERRVGDAVWKRLAGHDPGHDEHRMQAALAASRLASLGLIDLAREYPAWRGAHRRGFIDFLGVDRKNRLHVVETKVGTGDVRVVLQALDYATWVIANGSAIREERNWQERSGGEVVVIDLVLAPKSGGVAVGSYLAGQLEALDGGITWTITVVEDPLAEAPTLHGPNHKRLPYELGRIIAAPVWPLRWQSRINNELLGVDG